MWGERGYGDGSTRYVWLSSITLLPWLPNFPLQALPITISSLTSPWSISPQSTAALPWDGSTIPKFRLPAAVPSRGPASLSWVCRPGARTVWFSFHLSCHKSAVSLSALNVSPLTQTLALVWEIGPLLQFPRPPRADPVLLILLFFPLVPSSYRVLCECIYSFPLVRYSCLLSTGVGHALLCLKVYSWCIRGEKCTTSTYSIILFSSQLVFNKRKPHCLEIEKDLQNG